MKQATRNHVVLDKEDNLVRFSFAENVGNPKRARKAPFSVPAFTKQCRICDNHIHVRRFAPQQTALGQRPVCKQCQSKQETVNGQSHRS